MKFLNVIGKNMPRPLRIQYANTWYHVMNRGGRDETIFKEKKDCLAFIDLLKDIADMWNARIAAYCLMTNNALCGVPHKKCYVKILIMLSRPA